MPCASVPGLVPRALPKITSLRSSRPGRTSPIHRRKQKADKVELLRAELRHKEATRTIEVQEVLIQELRATVAEHRAWHQEEPDEQDGDDYEDQSQWSHRDGHAVHHESPAKPKYGTGTTLQFPTLTETRTPPTRTPRSTQAGAGGPPRLPVEQRQAPRASCAGAESPRDRQASSTGVFARDGGEQVRAQGTYTADEVAKLMQAMREQQQQQQQQHNSSQNAGRHPNRGGGDDPDPDVDRGHDRFADRRSPRRSPRPRPWSDGYHPPGGPGDGLRPPGGDRGPLGGDRGPPDDRGPPGDDPYGAPPISKGGY